MLNFFKDAGVSLSLDADRVKVEGLKQLPPGQAEKIREKIKTHRTEIMRELSKIPEPSPDSLGPEYESLWHRAWKLANEIDNPGGAPLAERKAKLPELDDLRARMAEIERQAAPTAGPEPETSPADTWHPWESSATTTPEGCPAQCKKTGKCYSKAYFEGKPGRAAECGPAKCERHTPAYLNRKPETEKNRC